MLINFISNHIKMKNILSFTLLFAMFVNSYSQFNQSTAIKIGYPIAIGNNFLNNKNSNFKYKGIADIGIDYSFYRIKKMEFGLLFNATFLNLEITDVNLLMLTPKLKMDYILDLHKIDIRPQISFGYSNWRFRGSDYIIVNEYEEMTIEGISENYDGLSMKFANKISFNKSKRINCFFEFAYEFTRLEKPNTGALDIKYNRNLQLFYSNIGIIWNFRK